MAVARLRVEQAGPMTTVQDGGRFGWMRYGVPHSGPIDRLSFEAAHTALGNRLDQAAIEVSLGGAALVCLEGEVSFAVSGAAFVSAADGLDGGGWGVGTLRAGMRLSVKVAGEANWGYICFAGQVRRPPWLGSLSTHALSGLGGGRIVAGEEIEIDAASAGAEARAFGAPQSWAPISNARIVIGPQDRFFERDALGLLVQESFRASAGFDRMGMVLEGPRLPPVSVDMVSEPALRGALQVDGAGRVTMLLADHQTTGGYPKIATVVAADVERIAQSTAGKTFRFIPVTRQAAVDIYRGSQAERAEYLSRIRSPESLSSRLLKHNLVGGVADGLGFKE